MRDFGFQIYKAIVNAPAKNEGEKKKGDKKEGDEKDKDKEKEKDKKDEKKSSDKSDVSVINHMYGLQVNSANPVVQTLN